MNHRHIQIMKTILSSSSASVLAGPPSARKRSAPELLATSAKSYFHSPATGDDDTAVKMSSKSIFHSLSATTGDGSVMEMSSLAGKVVYATNVASK
jgi:hypothetical protein